MADKKEVSDKEQENVKIITEQQLILINNQQAIYEILTELVKQVKELKPKPNH